MKEEVQLEIELGGQVLQSIDFQLSYHYWVVCYRKYCLLEFLKCFQPGKQSDEG